MRKLGSRNIIDHRKGKSGGLNVSCEIWFNGFHSFVRAAMIPKNSSRTDMLSDLAARALELIVQFVSKCEKRIAMLEAENKKLVERKIWSVMRSFNINMNDFKGRGSDAKWKYKMKFYDFLRDNYPNIISTREESKARGGPYTHVMVKDIPKFKKII